MWMVHHAPVSLAYYDCWTHCMHGLIMGCKLRVVAFLGNLPFSRLSSPHIKFRGRVKNSISDAICLVIYNEQGFWEEIQQRAGQQWRGENKCWLEANTFLTSIPPFLSSHLFLPTFSVSLLPLFLSSPPGHPPWRYREALTNAFAIKVWAVRTFKYGFK